MAVAGSCALAGAQTAMARRTIVRIIVGARCFERCNNREVRRFSPAAISAKSAAATRSCAAQRVIQGQALLGGCYTAVLRRETSRIKDVRLRCAQYGATAIIVGDTGMRSTSWGGLNATRRITRTSHAVFKFDKTCKHMHEICGCAAVGATCPSESAELRAAAHVKLCSRCTSRVASPEQTTRD